jgi:hypothetical protein
MLITKMLVAKPDFECKEVKWRKKNQNSQIVMIVEVLL